MSRNGILFLSLATLIGIGCSTGSASAPRPQSPVDAMRSAAPERPFPLGLASAEPRRSRPPVADPDPATPRSSPSPAPAASSSPRSVPPATPAPTSSQHPSRRTLINPWEDDAPTRTTVLGYAVTIPPGFTVGYERVADGDPETAKITNSYEHATISLMAIKTEPRTPTIQECALMANQLRTDPDRMVKIDAESTRADKGTCETEWHTDADHHVLRVMVFAARPGTCLRISADWPQHNHRNVAPSFKQLVESITAE